MIFRIPLPFSHFPIFSTSLFSLIHTERKNCFSNPPLSHFLSLSNVCNFRSLYFLFPWKCLHCVDFTIAGYIFCDFLSISKRFKRTEWLAPYCVKTVTVGIRVRIISAIVPTFKKRICINQSVIGVGCQIKYRRVQRIVQIYISSVFPVISRLLGRVLVRPTPPFSQFQPRFNGEAGKYSLFEWKRRKRRFFNWMCLIAKRALPFRIYRK